MEQPRPGGITWRIAGERLALLAWPRAILLQLAHPLVAAGVGDHSGFRSSPIAPFTRLHATVGAMRQITFGTRDQADAAVRGILRVHDRVNGALPDAIGGHAAGTRYSAHDPDLLVWVYATLLDSHVRVLEPVLGPFTSVDLDDYCRETAPLAVVLGAAEHNVPGTWAKLQGDMTSEMTSGRIGVGPQARALGRAVLRPALGWLVPPLQYAGELVTVGTLPAMIRDGYGFTWDAVRERRLQRLFTSLRAVRARTPNALARWPEARADGPPQASTRRHGAYGARGGQG